MSGLVLDIDDWAVAPGAPAYIERLAPYFLLMTGSDVDVTWYRKGTRIGSAKGFQGGDGVGPLSADFDRIVLESTTPQTVKVAISSDPVTITRLSGVVQVDGVVQTAADYSRSVLGESFVAYCEAGAVAGEYGIVQFKNPSDSGKNFVITKVASDASNISMEAPVSVALKPENILTAFASSNKNGQPRPNIELYSGTSVARPEPIRTHRVIDAGMEPLVLQPGGVLTSSTGDVSKAFACVLNYFEIDA